MTGLQLLFVGCCCSIVAPAGGFTVGGYSCVSGYWDTVTCVVNITGDPVGLLDTYSLTFIESEGVFSCPLVVMNPSYSCVCRVTKDSENLSNFHQYDIKLCHKSVCQSVTNDFEPSLNIQPTPPHQPEIQEAPETFNITWRSGYEDHRYLNSDLDYELLLSQSTETKTSRLQSLETSASIPRSQLSPRAILCIKVRSKPNNKRDYEGTWSEWSPSTCWKNKAGKGEYEDNTFVILIKSLGPVCVAVGVTLFVLRSPSVRMKIKTLSHTPTPAPFFQPLLQHGGNVQKWLSPQGKMVLTYKTEEILTTDAVIVVPRPVTKDPEESQVFHNPTVQLALTQCQSSYVGLPGLHEASTPVPMVCPGETSYTPLPCPVWGVDIEEVQVVSTLPKDFFNICRSDSGCSFEDPTQSPECSLPNSPPPCFCNDYCILNKTAGGFSPVLVSKGSSPSAPSDSLQHE
ncbi:interleukin 21 receptor, tandem duplicate 2 [Cyclopterus lumpus]|uniref:interleukin 21 receptor, tandem duplicate 2 n=1 Tax=Cyclopterus lumpus TaxID=8103 RepID=UPI0014870588|nr:interleukin 21 receptor, tandem duplicate 2 [Cyclopterus lumpus]